MNIILNRWRGTGPIFYIGDLKITGVILQSIFFGLLAVYLSGIWWHFIIGMLLYRAGESMGWGKWVGSLCYPHLIPEQKESWIKGDEGKRLPYTHYVANFFIKEKENYYWYCFLALAIRGMWWFIPLFTFLGYCAGIILIGTVIGLVLGILFSVACYLSTKVSWDFSIEWLNFHGGGAWENQEIIYGLLQDIAIIILICLI